MSIGRGGGGIARRLIGLLDGSGLTPTQLAAKLGTRQTTTGQWYKGRTLPSAEWLGELCQALHVNGHWLLTGQGPMAPPDVAAPGAVSEFEAGFQAGLEAARRAIPAAPSPRPALDPADAQDAADVREQVERAERSGPGRAGRAS